MRVREIEIERGRQREKRERDKSPISCSSAASFTGRQKLQRG